MVKFTKKQLEDLETVEYFMNPVWKIEVTNEHRKMFLEHSEKGLHADKLSSMILNPEKGSKQFINNPNYIEGFAALVDAKRWRGVHMQLYEEGVLEGTMPYSIILQGMTRSVVDFMKKEMFKGKDAEIIENCYALLDLRNTSR